MEEAATSAMSVKKRISNTKGNDGSAVPKLWGVPMKWISLVALTLQTTAQVLLIKWARSGATRREDGTMPYLPTTIVFFTEVLKMTVSFCLEVSARGSVGGAAREVRERFTMSGVELLKVSVPSLLYTIQNNLMFVSLDKLSAAVQQVTYQLKILTTAMLSVLILGKALGVTKWCALTMLLAGVTLVQWPKDWSAAMGGMDAGTSDAWLGFAAVLTACFTSGLASVYLEKILKQTDASIWIRNVQLGFFGAVMALFGAFSADGARIREGGFTQGYSVRVLAVIAMNACGGLLCAAVLKYADNILRCFSVALSIILTSALSWLVLLDFQPDALFVVGACLAIASTFLYSTSMLDGKCTPAKNAPPKKA